MLLHWPNPHVPLAETLGALAHAKQIGLTRHIGVSNFTVALIEEAVASLSGAAGLRPGRIPSLSRPGEGEGSLRGQRHGARRLQSRCQGPDQERPGPVADRPRPSQERRRQICLRWLVQQNVSAIPRTSRIERLSENIDIFDFELSGEEMEPDLPPRQPQGPDDRFRLRAEMGLRRPQ